MASFFQKKRKIVIFLTVYVLYVTILWGLSTMNKWVKKQSKWSNGKGKVDANSQLQVINIGFVGYVQRNNKQYMNLLIVPLNYI